VLAQKIQIDDLAWVVAEANKLWSGENDTPSNGLRQLLEQNPQPHLQIPEWVRLDADPLSPEYKAQVLALWEAIHASGKGSSNAAYDIHEHEQDVASHLCPIRFPGFMSRRDPVAVRHAAFEYAMLGDIMLQSGLSAGKRALEYGAGSGNVAINLARMGVEVDTVDISKTYCGHIQQNADYFGVPLRPHNREFGYDPLEGKAKYDCILFHACFHHSLDHVEMVAKIATMLADDGVLLLSNEPISDDYYCPWGLRTDPESISVIAARGWMELGFRLSYLQELFLMNGLLLERVRDNFSGVPLFAARKVMADVALVHGSAFTRFITGVHAPETDGVWTEGETVIPLFPTPGATRAEVAMVNSLPVDKVVECEFDQQRFDVAVGAGQQATITVDLPAARRASLRLTLRTSVTRPADCIPGSADERALGVMLQSLSYR
jgi:2-polyprenyl-3-methyl-5-hydroxy-6-metoxy-1,4-benzoquinol methylase